MNLSDALAQSPTVRKAQSRSKYLEDALASIQASGEKIQSWGELAAKLAALGVTQYSSKKANEGLQEALRSEFEGRQSSLLSQLEGLGGPSPMASPAAPAPAPIAPQAPTPQPGAMAQGEGSGSLAAALGAPPPQAPTQPSNLWANLIRQESGGNQAAVSPRGAFGRAQLMPDTAAQIAREMGDPSLAQRARTDPAVNERMGQYYLDQQMQRFGNPAVALAAYNAGPEKAAEWVRRFGMPEPGRELEWAQRITFPETRQYVTNIIGRTGQQGQAPQAAPPAPVEFSPETNQALQGLGIGLGGQPSAPASVPAQEPPPAPSPQGVGGNPQQPQQQPNPLGPTPGEMQMMRQLASRPETYDQAQAMFMKIQERMNAPRERNISTVNGMPVAIDPYNPQGGAQAVPMPQALQSRVITAEQAGIQAPPGTYVEVQPNGGMRVVQSPAAGYQAASAPGQPYREAPVPGGAQDPNRQQAPGQGYEYRDGGQRPIRGGPAYVQAATGLRQDIEKDPAFRGYARSASIYDSMRRGLDTPGRVADINFVYGLATIFDPDSVVREGEQVVIRNAQGLPDWLQGEINRVNGGQGLSRDQRERMLAESSSRIQGTRAQLDQRYEFYSGIAERNGIDRRDVLPPMPAFEPWSPPRRQAQSGARPQGQAPAGDRPPVEGARKARDGHWYVKRGNQFFRVDN